MPNKLFAHFTTKPRPRMQDGVSHADTPMRDMNWPSTPKPLSRWPGTWRGVSFKRPKINPVSEGN